MKKTTTYRQGDVLLIPVTSIPEAVERRSGRVTLALGEVTGHHHSFADNAAVVGYSLENEKSLLAQYIDVIDAAPLTHQEHETITVPPGKYEVHIQQEYTPQELRNVAD